MTSWGKHAPQERHKTQSEGSLKPEEEVKAGNGERTKNSDSGNNIVSFTEKKRVTQLGIAQMRKKPRKESRAGLHHSARSCSTNQEK